MDIPSSLFCQCPKCGEESFGRVMKGRAVGKQGLKAGVKCGSCAHVFDTEARLPKQVKVRTIISKGEDSEKTDIRLAEDWEVKLMDEVMMGDTCVQVTGIETNSGRVKKALPGEIKTLWTRYFNEIIVKISINKGRKTESLDLIVLPTEEFTVGEVIQVGKKNLRIYKIKVAARVLNRTGAKAIAKDVVRVYGKKPARPGQSRL